MMHAPESNDCTGVLLQVIKCWRQHIGQKTETELLQQYGVPGLLISGAVILGKLVQLGAPTDLHTQLEVHTPSTMFAAHKVLTVMSWFFRCFNDILSLKHQFPLMQRETERITCCSQPASLITLGYIRDQVFNIHCLDRRSKGA